MQLISWSEIIIRLSLAALFGAIVGIERERKDWAAGLRTHMMVCVGASLTMMVSAFGFTDILGTANVVLDPSRIAAQVISGIGFIGAGTILFLRQEVIRGLTTAAGLWTVAGIGLATGGGMYFAASFATLVVIIILWLMKPIENRFFGRYKKHYIKIIASAASHSALIGSINELLEEEKITFQNLRVERKKDESIVSIRLSNIRKPAHMMSLVDKLHNLPEVVEVFLENTS